jgi:hypothetical protein
MDLDQVAHRTLPHASIQLVRDEGEPVRIRLHVGDGNPFRGLENGQALRIISIRAVAPGAASREDITAANGRSLID